MQKPDGFGAISTKVSLKMVYILYQNMQENAIKRKIRIKYKYALGWILKYLMYQLVFTLVHTLYNCRLRNEYKYHIYWKSPAGPAYRTESRQITLRLCWSTIRKTSAGNYLNK
jgi:hypothetical protein